MNRILIFLAALIFSAGSSYAQETTADDLSGWANEWKHAFSKEGIKEMLQEPSRLPRANHCDRLSWTSFRNRILE